ncbi:MAG: hypothetical protein GX483_02840 [Actinomycetaceae bacterium]|nr:hypothetical protein [Actinomycetaceae bacterium]
MNKKVPVVVNTLLLAWFGLDMTGFHVGDHLLVTRSWREDGIFMLIALAMFTLFVAKERVGKWALTAWLSLWLTTQLLAHEYCIFAERGPICYADGLSRFFADTIQVVEIPGHYFPDLYHVVLHVLLLVSLIVTARYAWMTRKPQGFNSRS